MAITEKDLDEIFKYHDTEPDQVSKYVALRLAALDFARAIVKNTPACPHQTLAIFKVREAVMTANAAIALKGKY